MTQELIQNVVDVIDSAHNQKTELTELLLPLKEAREQINFSKSESCKNLTDYFNKVKDGMIKTINKRLTCLLSQVESMAKEALEPLRQCEDVINQSLVAAARIIEEGNAIMKDNPSGNLDRLVKFKDNPDIKALTSIPEVPSLPDVPYICIDVSTELEKHLNEFINQEGRVIERPPVHITDITERPGSLIVNWTEIDDDIEPGDFCLEYTNTSVKFNTASSTTFHEVYRGPEKHYIARQIKTNRPYSFRVRCRCENSNRWTPWSVPKEAITTIPHYEWSNCDPEYSLSSENKIARRTNEGETQILYSSTSSLTAGGSVMFKFIDAGESSPMDGVGLAIDNQDTFSLQRENAVFLSSRGGIFVNGQEMKNRLPDLTKGSKLNIETEVLSNGKIRVSIEVQDKAVTFDWKIDQEVELQQISGMGSMTSGQGKGLFFGLRFSHEDWAVVVE